MATPYFTKDYIQFFTELEKNNTTDWFNKNRKRYEKEIKLPFTTFVSDTIGEIQKHDRTITMSPGDAIFRINKDIRFSADKTPYKTSMSAAVSAKGKDPGYPGIYFEFGSTKAVIIGGIYAPGKADLFNIRNAIMKDVTKFREIITGKDFVRKFHKIDGEKNKILPSPFKEFVAEEPAIANKQFFYSSVMPARQILKPGLVETIIDYYLAGKAVNDFLIKAME